ncbi:MAG: polysaccharide deacetylase family protein [Candidatus Cloacimonetes bacterium]|nr:polysaccharide deacetylase family protein [Candidatus Cloacimonadota bacterium]
MYHNLADVVDEVYTVSYKTFKYHIGLLISEGFIIEGFDGLASRMITNQWPERYAVLTFDDGYKSNLRAAKILSGYNACATFFIAKNFIKSNNYLDKNDLL